VCGPRSGRGGTLTSPRQPASVDIQRAGVGVIATIGVARQQAAAACDLPPVVAIVAMVHSAVAMACGRMASR